MCKLSVYFDCEKLLKIEVEIKIEGYDGEDNDELQSKELVELIKGIDGYGDKIKKLSKYTGKNSDYPNFFLVSPAETIKNNDLNKEKLSEDDKISENSKELVKLASKNKKIMKVVVISFYNPQTFELKLYMDCKEGIIEKTVNYTKMTISYIEIKRKIGIDSFKDSLKKYNTNLKFPNIFHLTSDVAENKTLNKEKMSKESMITLQSSPINLEENYIIIVSYYDPKNQPPQEQAKIPEKIFLEQQGGLNHQPFLIPGGWWPCERIYAFGNESSSHKSHFAMDMKQSCSLSVTDLYFLYSPNMNFGNNIFIQDQFVFGYYFSHIHGFNKLLVIYPRNREARDFSKKIQLKNNICFSNNIYDLTKEYNEDLNNGYNFGGNILISPPVIKETEEISKSDGNAGPKVPRHPSAPFGKMIVGDSERGLMGNILRAFLTSQKIQPVLPVDTSWLKVGHVDEFLSFVPDNSMPNSNDKFKALYADPELMIFILNKINTEAKHRYNYFFLGKYDKEKRYAEISVADMLDEGKRSNYTARQYNQRLQNERLVPIKKRLQQGLCLEDKDFISVPIFFLRPASVTGDTVPIFNTGLSSNNTTEAQSVNIINLQYVNGHVLVPRPFGPRLIISKAKSIVKDCLLHKSINFDVDTLAINSNMTNFHVWHDAGTSLEKIALFYLDIQDEQHIDEVINHITKQGNLTSHITELRNSFTEKILEKNIDKFVDDKESKEYKLIQTTKIIIPEETQAIDVIELYMYSIFKYIGIPETNVHFIDDWAYHINSGEVHCGTVSERSLPSFITLQVYSEAWEKMNQHESNKDYIFTYDPKQ